MQEPLIIHFRQMDPSPAVEARIREKVQALERFHSRLTRCRVTVEKAQHRRHQGDLFRVRLDLTVPGRKEIVIDRTGPENHAHEDVYVALRDAFAAAARRLEDEVREGRGDVKAHAAPTHGEVLRLFPEEGYGFIRTSDGQEVYFHRNSVVDGFTGLALGDRVRLEVAEAEGVLGYQASTVRKVGKHHPVG
ncbi:MAG TPA: HPF/RaiA family ribosome-associated protein [Geminicoccaceae bacterium]|nr:HPF/RaiA family ribosome-associated protein [Geminicoccaceae bacterium]